MPEQTTGRVAGNHNGWSYVPERCESWGQVFGDTLPVIEVVSGRIAITSAIETVDCESGTLINLEPGEYHAIRALADSQLLLLLAPWPAKTNNTEGEADPRHLPRNAVAPPEDEAQA